MADVLGSGLNVVGGEEYTPHDNPGEWNAIAWLAMDNDELARCSASLEHDAEIVPLSSQADITRRDQRHPTQREQKALRANADKMAREHASKKFVDDWIKEHR